MLFHTNVSICTGLQMLVRLKYAILMKLTSYLHKEELEYWAKIPADLQNASQRYGCDQSVVNLIRGELVLFCRGTFGSSKCFEANLLC